MNKDSKNLCAPAPIINLDSEGVNLICCYKPLDLNLGQICPSLYYKPYIINIISFVKEDLKIKIIKYHQENIVKKDKKIEKIENTEKEEKDEEKEGETPIEENSLLNIDNETEQKYLSVKEFIKRGDNIQLFVDIPRIFDIENTIKIKSILNIESSSGKKMDLNVNIILSTIPISILLSCKKYKLIKGERDKEEKKEIIFDDINNYKHYFKLDAYELLGGEEIEFNLLNYKNNKPVESYISVKSLEKNTSMMPEFSREKQENNFKINIPKYELTNKDKDIPRLKCILELFINKNFVIYIEIDSFINPN